MLKANWLDEVLESINEEYVTPCHPVSPQEKQIGDKITEPKTRMDKGSSNYVTLVTRVTLENNKIEKNLADILELKRESRRLKVLQTLVDSPSIQRAFVTDTESDPNNVILTMAIRDVASFEMLIPLEKYDAFLLLELLEKVQIQ